MHGTCDLSQEGTEQEVLNSCAQKLFDDTSTHLMAVYRQGPQKELYLTKGLEMPVPPPYHTQEGSAGRATVSERAGAQDASVWSIPAALQAGSISGYLMALFAEPPRGRRFYLQIRLPTEQI